MQKESIEKTASLDGTDEELIDVLIAISVVPDQLRRNPGRDRQSFEGILFRNRRSSPGKA